MKVSFLLLISFFFYSNSNAQSYKIEIEDITNKIEFRTPAYQPRHRIENSSLTSKEVGETLLENNEIIKEIYNLLEKEIIKSNSNQEKLNKNGKLRAIIEGGWSDEDEKVIWFRIYAKSKIREITWDEGVIANKWVISNIVDKIMGDNPAYQNAKQRYFRSIE